MEEEALAALVAAKAHLLTLWRAYLAAETSDRYARYLEAVRTLDRALLSHQQYDYASVLAQLS